MRTLAVILLLLVVPAVAVAQPGSPPGPVPGKTLQVPVRTASAVPVPDPRLATSKPGHALTPDNLDAELRALREALRRLHATPARERGPAATRAAAPPPAASPALTPDQKAKLEWGRELSRDAAPQRRTP